MVEFWLYWARDRDAAADWLGALFRDGWILGGIADQCELFLDKNGGDILIVDGETLTARGTFGRAAPEHPRPVSSAFLNAVRAAALQPAMGRAVGGPASLAKTLRVETIFGPISYHLDTAGWASPDEARAFMAYHHRK